MSQKNKSLVSQLELLTTLKSKLDRIHSQQTKTFLMRYYDKKI